MQQLPKLQFEFDELEPFIDKKTVEIHYTKHHQAYVDNLNKVLEKYPSIENESIEELMQQVDSLEMEEADRQAFINHGGGHINHTLYWQNLNPDNKKNSDLIERINKQFGSLSEFKDKFTKTAMGQFGSGWAWLVEDSNKLKVISTGNQNSPLIYGFKPIIALDVWEHAYYLRYQNKRAEYIRNWWRLIKLLPQE
jgi:superoxide dismutase, Fe-Mn family